MFKCLVQPERKDLPQKVLKKLKKRKSKRDDQNNTSNFENVKNENEALRTLTTPLAASFRDI
ncbi:unnamed protein product, partial [Hymenolepis diminuta]